MAQRVEVLATKPDDLGWISQNPRGQRTEHVLYVM